jgi:hypothetical protein
MKAIITDSPPGNVHSAASFYNEIGVADHLLSLSYDGGNYSTAVFLIERRDVRAFLERTGSWRSTTERYKAMYNAWAEGNETAKPERLPRHAPGADLGPRKESLVMREPPLIVYIDEATDEQLDAFILATLESKQDRVEALLMNGCDRGEGDQSRDGASTERASLGSHGTVSNERRPGQGPGCSGQGEESGQEPVRPPRRVDDPDGHLAPPKASQAVGPAYRRVYVIDDPRHRSLGVKALELAFMYGGNPWKFGPRCYRKKD